MGISHVRQALNAYAPNNSPSLAELLQDVPFSPSFDSVSEHSLYNLYVPSGTADARHHFNQLIHATFTSIYAAPSSWKVRGEVKQWIAVSTPQQMTAAMNSCASDDQIDFLLSCHRGEAITADKLQKLQRIYSGGDSGDVIYMILARPRNVDGRNSWKARYGGNILRPYVGSAERLMKFSGSQRIYEHGDPHKRLADQTEKGKQAYQFAFGAMSEPLPESELEASCCAAFEILNILEPFKIRGVVLLLEQALCQLTHAWGPNYSPDLKKYQIEKQILPSTARAGTNDSQAVEVPYRSSETYSTQYISLRGQNKLSAQERSDIAREAYLARRDAGPIAQRASRGGKMNLGSKIAKLCDGEGLDSKAKIISKYTNICLPHIPAQWRPPYNYEAERTSCYLPILPQILLGLKIEAGLSFKVHASFAGTEDVATFDILLSKPDDSWSISLRTLAEYMQTGGTGKVEAYYARLQNLLGNDGQRWATKEARTLYLEGKIRLCEGLPEEVELDDSQQKAHKARIATRKSMAKRRRVKNVK